VVKPQLDITAPPVPFRPDPTNDPGFFEDAEMVGQQVAAQSEVGGKLAR
jgi:hypothetical protein